MADAAISPDADLVGALKALANPVRLQLLLWLRDPERHFAQYEAIADRAESTVSAYMAELQRAGLVRATRVGKWTHYRRDEGRIAELVAQLGRTL
jgi:ArsR family transcriptional regulator